jgi:hypothetical protein
MTATPIASTTRYINPGVTKIYYCSTISDKSAPTRSELDAGTDLTGEINAIDGFVTTGDDVETPDMASTFTSKIPGRTSADDSSITFYADLTGADARALLPRGTNGYIVIMDGGDVAGSLMDVYPIRVKSLGKPRSTEGTDPATVEIQFSITAEPAEDVEIPT